MLSMRKKETEESKFTSTREKLLADMNHMKSESVTIKQVYI
jgi:hypothetical protein